MAAKAEAETVTAIAQTIASSKICRAKFGTYTGAGLSGQNHPNSVECGFCPAVLVLFRADGGQKTTAIRGVTACSSGIGSMNNYYTWGDSGVSWVSQTLDSDSGGYMASSQFNSSGKEYCYLVLGYDADWIKQKQPRAFCSPLTGVTTNSGDPPTGYRVYDACRGSSVFRGCRLSMS